MEQSFHIQSKSGKRGNKRKNPDTQKLNIIKADYISGFKILLTFSNGRQRIFDFHPLFLKTVKGFYAKYLVPSNFRKFIIENGNIFWGKDEDVIFPVSFLYNSKYSRSLREEVLYVI
jgi:hypothetical protein